MPFLSCVDPKEWKTHLDVAYMNGIAISILTSSSQDLSNSYIQIDFWIKVNREIHIKQFRDNNLQPSVLTKQHF